MFSLTMKIKMACLFLFLITFLKVTSVLSQNDKFLYTSDLDDSPEDYIKLDLLEYENTHFLKKREVVGTEIPAVPLNNDTETNATIGETAELAPKKRTSKLPKNFYPLNSTQQPNSSLTAEKGGVSKIDKNVLTLPLMNNTMYSTRIKNMSESDETVGSKLPVLEDSDEENYIDPDTTDTENEIAAKHNMSVVKTDSHIYYNSTLKNDPKVGQHYWVELSERNDVKINELLSKSHRRAATVKLSFEFPFYGHLIKNVTIATGGFLYTGGYVHSWLAATQYIAPLMANFDTSISNTSFIKYADNGTAFTVEWENVTLQERPGEFTFQVTLHNNGDIIFVYKHIPLFVEKILDVNHPVKVGLSDAYIMDRTIFFVRRKTIYEYHRVDFKKEDIRNWTVIYLQPLSTCLDSNDCVSCLNRNISFKCMWCPAMNKCSSGVDRYRQEWLGRDCNRKRIDNETMCSVINSTDEATLDHSYNVDSTDESSTAPRVYVAAINKPEQVGVSGIIAILFLVSLVVGLVVWVLYAYRNPHTTSGQILIRYRPSQWRWRRGEARYTAATIHM